MRARKINPLLQVRVSDSQQQKLVEAAERLDINVSELARLRAGLPVIERKLPATNEAIPALPLVLEEPR